MTGYNHFFVKGVLRVLVATLIVMVAWLLLPSALFFKPVEVQIDGYNVTVYRDAPLEDYIGTPVIAYVETVRPIDPVNDHNSICHDNNGAGYKYDLSKASGQWSIAAWAADCMNGPYRWRASWTVKLFGLIPLRPVSLSTVVRPEEVMQQKSLEKQVYELQNEVQQLRGN